ncbi:MAG: NAD-dependent malic enzyme, mitochondrial [Alectoria sarmentosa]|nr:MAG: NAD-dependent malic enzyme, mitochondrial [Alectoria sarmentosa]
MFGIIYTAMEGDAVQNTCKVFRKSEGCFLNIFDQDRIEDNLAVLGDPEDIDYIVVTDGEEVVLHGFSALLVAIMADLHVSGLKLTDMKLVAFGSGTAEIGIADHVRDAVAAESGKSKEDAAKQIWCVDKPGLLLKSQGDLTIGQGQTARDDEEWQGKDHNDLLSVIKEVKPHVMTGTSIKPRASTEEVVKEMSKHVDGSVIFPLSNPTRPYEADRKDINECYIAFPGVGLGAVLCRSRVSSDKMLVAAVKAIAAQLPALKDPDKGLVPDIMDVREISVHVAKAVIKQAIEEDLATEKKIPENDKDLEEWIREQMWEPRYRPLVRVDKKKTSNTGKESSELAVRGADEDEGVCGAWDQVEEVEGVDVVEGEGGGDAEAVDQVGEDGGVVFLGHIPVTIQQKANTAIATDLDMSSSTPHLSVKSALPEDTDADRPANSPSPSVASVKGVPNQDSATLAHKVAGLLYRNYSDPNIPQVVKYEKDIVLLRKAIQAQQKADEMAKAEARHLLSGNSRMFVKGSKDQEPYYDVDMAEFEKGILIIGPPNISQLMTSLESSTFVRHCLLRNNMIGPVGARLISDFVLAHPDRTETWYLAGNCTDLAEFERRVSAGQRPEASTNLYNLTTKTSKLRSLDLDQTELSDEGVAHLFSHLANHHNATSLRHIYLNAVGIGQCACKSLATYLSSPHCTMESVYLSNNPMGDAGAEVLAKGLTSNKSLLRLTLTSCGLKSEGPKSILQALTGQSRLMTLHMGQSFATEDLGMRYNYLEHDVVEIGMTLSALESLSKEVVKPETLVAFSANSVYNKISARVKLSVNERIQEYVRKLYGGIDVARFDAEEKRWLISPKDVRFIDSTYRNRDAELARRRQLILKKVWQDGMETVNGVLNADDSQLAAEMEG